MGRALSEELRRERASPTPRPRRCVGPNRDPHVLSHHLYVVI